MNSPFFSIIIPTRNRYETLQYAIRTVLNQEFKSFELIISDNSDTTNLPGLELIKEYLNDERIRYYRPSSVLSMPDNWEFAVSKSSGKYVIVFGDDDGLIQGSLKYIYNIIQKTNSDVISWARVEYSWPDRIPEQYSNLIIIPYTTSTGILNSKKFIKNILFSKGDYRYLPMFYNSAISNKLIGILKEKTGRIFNAVSPDIYSGYAFAHLMKNYITVGHPLSINGVSSKSNGAAQVNEEEAIKAHLNVRESIKVDYWGTLKNSQIKWPDLLPQINSSYLAIVEPFIQLSKFFPELTKYISRKKIYINILTSLKFTCQQDLNTKLEIILGSAANDKRFYRWLENYLIHNKPKVIDSTTRDLKNLEVVIGFDGYRLVIDASMFGVKNVYDVSLFIHNIFGNLKHYDFRKPVNLTFFARIKKAASIVLRGG